MFCKIYVREIKSSKNAKNTTFICLRICDPYAEMIHGSCFGTPSIFDDERHWQ